MSQQQKQNPKRVLPSQVVGPAKLNKFDECLKYQQKCIQEYALEMPTAGPSHVQQPLDIGKHHLMWTIFLNDDVETIGRYSVIKVYNEDEDAFFYYIGRENGQDGTLTPSIVVVSQYESVELIEYLQRVQEEMKKAKKANLSEKSKNERWNIVYDKFSHTEFWSGADIKLRSIKGRVCKNPITGDLNLFLNKPSRGLFETATGSTVKLNARETNGLIKYLLRKNEEPNEEENWDKQDEKRDDKKEEDDEDENCDKSDQKKDLKIDEKANEDDDWDKQ